MTALRRLASMTLAMNLVVILLGALVRATGSGAGCGRSWPTCQGDVIPAQLEGATLIEFSHRAASGVALVMVAVLFALIRRTYDSGTQIRTASVWSVVAIVGEALIGAGIVLFDWVADDSSVARTIAVPLHLVNTLLLLASLTAVVLLIDGRRFQRPSKELRRVIGAGLGAMVLVVATGAVAALADTLFPAASLAEAVAEDVSGTSAILTRLRVLHPVVAVGTGILLVWLVSRPGVVHDLGTGLPARVVVWLVVLQIAAGGLNVLLLVPLWTQLVHLLLAELLWIAFVWFSLDAVADQSNAIRSA